MLFHSASRRFVCLFLFRCVLVLFCLLICFRLVVRLYHTYIRIVMFPFVSFFSARLLWSFSLNLCPRYCLFFFIYLFINCVCNFLLCVFLPFNYLFGCFIIICLFCVICNVCMLALWMFFFSSLCLIIYLFDFALFSLDLY